MAALARFLLLVFLGLLFFSVAVPLLAALLLRHRMTRGRPPGRRPGEPPGGPGQDPGPVIDVPWREIDADDDPPGRR